jgi:hypothetical protein
MALQRRLISSAPKSSAHLGRRHTLSTSAPKSSPYLGRRHALIFSNNLGPGGYKIRPLCLCCRLFDACAGIRSATQRGDAVEEGHPREEKASEEVHGEGGRGEQRIPRSAMLHLLRVSLCLLLRRSLSRTSSTSSRHSSAARRH